MNDEIIQKLKNWKSSIDVQISGTEKEIQNKINSNVKAVGVRNDLKELVKFLSDNDIPDGVKRAINHCLSWNPFT